MNRTFDYKTLQVSRSNWRGGVDAYGWGTYPRHSVLAGQPMKTFIDHYDSEEEARAAHPDLKEGYSSPLMEPQVSLSHLPDEDDPVAGGMYPDDYDSDYGDPGDVERSW